MQTTTTYSNTFGARPKAKEDYDILKYKSFADLTMCSILKPHVLAYLDRWLKINDQNEFKGRIFFTVRDMYTIVRCQEAPISTGMDTFVWTKIDTRMKVPRFDKLKINAALLAKKDEKAHARRRSAIVVTKPAARSNFGPLINAK